MNAIFSANPCAMRDAQEEEKKKPAGGVPLKKREKRRAEQSRVGGWRWRGGGYTHYQEYRAAREGKHTGP